jgi:DNA processing protein
MPDCTERLDMRFEDAVPWLHLHRLTGGGAGLRRLLTHFGDIPAICAAPRSELLPFFDGDQSPVDALRAGPDAGQFEAERTWLDDPSNHLVAITDSAYPSLLHEIPDPPPLLFVRGDATLLCAPQLAVVGSRNPSRGGSDNARAFSDYLTRAGLLVTSGLALGIDACAHEAALAVGGKTIAIAATGLDRVYPAAHRDLAHRIVAQGALVSEFALGTPPRRENFPRRNRLISGLSLGVLVVEAALKSGSLITARLAAEQGREVFAIPGSIHSPLARGCHALIRQGAKLVETAPDILEELGALARFVAAPPGGVATVPGTPPDPAQQELLELMGYDPVEVDMLIERSGLTPGSVSSMLLHMELCGLIEARPGGRVQRTS